MSLHNRIHAQTILTSESNPGHTYTKSFWTNGRVTIGVHYPSGMMGMVDHLPIDAEKTGEWKGDK